MPSPGNTQLVYGCASKDSLAPAVQSRWGIKQGLLRRVVGLCRSEMTTNFSGFVCEFYLCQGCSWKAHDLINTWLMAFGKKKNVWLVNMRLEGLDIWAIAFDDSPLIVESYAPLLVQWRDRRSLTCISNPSSPLQPREATNLRNFSEPRCSQKLEVARSSI